MLSRIKKYLKKRLFNILLSEMDGFKLKFIHMANAELKNNNYEIIRKKYSIDSSFRFNGDIILFYGNGKIICGSNSYIGSYSMLQAYDDCVIKIGNNCSISSNVRIFTQTNIADQDFSNQNREIKIGNVYIEDFTWIGANVVINPGVTIGRNAIVGANSVVTKNIPANSIYGGVPAKLIRNKSKEIE